MANEFGSQCPPASPVPDLRSPAAHSVLRQRDQVVHRLSPLATACYRPPDCQRPNRTRSRRAVRPYSACHGNSAYYRTRQFLRTNQSVFPARLRRSLTTLSDPEALEAVAPGVPAGPLWVAMRIPSLCDHARPGKGEKCMISCALALPSFACNLSVP